MFTVTPIIDLKGLNLYVRHKPFKMKMVRQIHPLLEQNEQDSLLDMPDALLHVPLHPTPDSSRGSKSATALFSFV